MLLFFVISMVAAYASRNLIFEQKTSANQYRATQAFESAEAGLEWAIALLNGGRIDAACAASTDGANNSFRARYLIVDANGSFTRRNWVSAGTTVPLRPGCVRTDAGWSCSCPAAGDAALVAPVGEQNYPAFRVRFDEVGQPGAVRIVATGCTRLDNACLNSGQGTGGEAAAVVSVVVALASALPTPPPAALTVRGDLNVGAAFLGVQNTDVATHGLTANAGGVVNAPNAQWVTVPGSPAERSFVANDPTLATLDGARLFTTLFRVDKATYRQFPGTVRLNDCADACSQKLIDAVQANPGHVIWVDGDLRIQTNATLGSAAEPVAIVATGNVILEAASIDIYGLLYSQAANWNNTGLGAVRVHGAAVAEGHFVGNGQPAFEYDPAILKTLQVATGSLVRVPGSWRDF